MTSHDERRRRRQSAKPWGAVNLTQLLDQARDHLLRVDANRHDTVLTLVEERHHNEHESQWQHRDHERSLWHPDPRYSRRTILVRGSAGRIADIHRHRIEELLHHRSRYITDAASLRRFATLRVCSPILVAGTMLPLAFLVWFQLGVPPLVSLVLATAVTVTYTVLAPLRSSRWERVQRLWTDNVRFQTQLSLSDYRDLLPSLAPYITARIRDHLMDLQPEAYQLAVQMMSDKHQSEIERRKENSHRVHLSHLNSTIITPFVREMTRRLRR